MQRRGQKWEQTIVLQWDTCMIKCYWSRGIVQTSLRESVRVREGLLEDQPRKKTLNNTRN